MYWRGRYGRRDQSLPGTGKQYFLSDSTRKFDRLPVYVEKKRLTLSIPNNLNRAQDRTTSVLGCTWERHSVENTGCETHNA